MESAVGRLATGVDHLMAECPVCKGTLRTSESPPGKTRICPACGNRADSPMGSPPAEPWWVSSTGPVPLPETTASSSPSLPSEPWWVSSPLLETNEPKRVPIRPDEESTASVGDDSVKRNDPAAEKTTTSPPPLPPVPLAVFSGTTVRTEPAKIPLPTRARFEHESADEPDEPVSWIERLRRLDGGTAAALFCGSVALLLASFADLSFLTKPLAALGLLIGLLAGVLPALRRRTRWIAPVAVSFLCLFALLFVGAWPTSSPPPPPVAVAVPFGPGGMSAHPAVAEDDWVDAAANALRREDVRVQVVSVQVGRVELKNRSGNGTLSPDKHLAIRLRVSYDGVLSQQTPYEPWADLTGSPSKHAPTLTDNTGRTYTQKTFDAGWKVVGRADVDALNPGHQVKEVLVFPVPPKNVEYLGLELPASAFGRAGAFRFRIPRGMIQGL